LVTQHTNLFLLHERAEENKAEGLPQLQQVAQMQAVGFGGYGSVRRAAPDMSIMRMSCNSEAFAISDSLSASSLGGDYGRLNTPSVWRTNRTHAASKVDGMASAGMDDIEIPAFLRKQTDQSDIHVHSSSIESYEASPKDSDDTSFVSKLVNTVNHWIAPVTITKQNRQLEKSEQETKLAKEATLQDIVIALNAASIKTTSFRIALQHTLKLELPTSYTPIIIKLTKLTKDSATSWALLIEWMIEQKTLQKSLEKHAQRLIRDQLKLVTEDIKTKAVELFKKEFVISELHS
jgi:hypothetical protein